MRCTWRGRSLRNARSSPRLRSASKSCARISSSRSALPWSMEAEMFLLYVFVMCCQSSCLPQAHSWAGWDSSVWRPAALQAGSWGSQINTCNVTWQQFFYWSANLIYNASSWFFYLLKENVTLGSFSNLSDFNKAPFAFHEFFIISLATFAHYQRCSRPMGKWGSHLRGALSWHDAS